MTLTYDSNHDGEISGSYDHIDVSDTWNCYVKRVIDEDFSKVNSGRWLNPNAVMIFSHQPEDMASVELPYQLFRPALDEERIITVPKQIDYALADENLRLPLFIQVPDGGKVNTAFNWIKTDMPTISSASVQNLMGTVTAYSNFKPTDGNVQIRGSYTAPGSTKSRIRILQRGTYHPPQPVETRRCDELRNSPKLRHVSATRLKTPSFSSLRTPPTQR